MSDSPLLSLDAARLAIGQTAAAEAEVRFYIDAITPIMEDIVGPISPTPCEEWHDGGADTIVLLERPVLSITSMTESSGTVVRTLTEQALEDGTSYDAYGYTVDLSTGVVHRRSAGSAMRFAGGRRNVHVVYSAGRSSVPSNIVLAARRLFRHLWQQEKQGYRPDLGAPESVPTQQTPSGFLVPKVVVELCGNDARPMGTA